MYEFETKALHEGWNGDGFSHSVNTPLYLTTAYTRDSTEHARRLSALEEGGNIYTRLSNPTTDVLETRFNALEGSVGAIATATGHSAIFMLMLSLAHCGDEIVSSSCIYGGAVNMFRHTLSNSGIKVNFVHPTDLAGFEAAINEKTRAVFVETVGNPTCDLCDIPALADICHRHGIPLIADSTFTTPYLIRPIDMGADIVVHSATKHIAGHGDVMGGIIVDSGKFDWASSGRFPQFSEPNPSYHGVTFTEMFGNAALVAYLRTCAMRDYGVTISPFNSFMLLRGLETLALRMERACANAKAAAEFLEGHPCVEKVLSPYVKSSKYYELGQQLLPKGSGGVICFEIKGGREAGAKFIDSLKLIQNVANLGDTRSLVSHPASTTHSQLTDAQLKASGISAGTIRLSLGLENVEDILADLSSALDAASK